MKTLHKFIIKSYLGPFVLTLFISIFILLMQFLWKYIDDLVGKGLEWYIIGKLLFYASATLVPLALPLAILLSSIMTFGNLAENYELVALKSAGLSLQKTMFPLVITSAIISITAFFFSNNVLPYANLKMGSLLYDVRESKPALNIREGIFYGGIEGYSIRIGKKEKDGNTIKNILIYDHTERVGNNKVIIAESGKMEMSADKQYLLLTLHNGYGYDDVMRNSEGGSFFPFFRNQFKEQLIRFDLSAFKLTRTDEELFKNNYQMLNIKQLHAAMDSLEVKKKIRKEELLHQLTTNYYVRSSNFIKSEDSLYTIPLAVNFLSAFDSSETIRILETASITTRSAKAQLEYGINEIQINNEVIARHEIEWHKKFTLSFACFVLFFIGAPLGAIIRKGGLGLPGVVSVLFFIVFHVLSITGEKFAKEGVLPPYQGMWMASAILLPIGVFLTYKATVDSVLFDINAYIAPFKKLFSRKNNS